MCKKITDCAALPESRRHVFMKKLLERAAQPVGLLFLYDCLCME
nr:hypothetical protein [Ectobacillus panaciterrae]